MSKNAYLARLTRHNWLVDGPLAIVVDRNIVNLQHARYAAGTVKAYLRCLAHFAYWLQVEGFSLSNVKASLIDQFLRVHLPTCACPPPCKVTSGECRAALGHLLRLIDRDIPRDECSDDLQTPVSAELERFRRYLVNTCGVAANTCQYRLKHVGDFLAQHIQVALVGTACLTAHDIQAFVIEVAQRWKPASLGIIGSSLRSYLRFRALAGDQTNALIAAVPRIANWTHTTLPKALSELDIVTLLNAFDHTTASGQRDFAVARCLLDLGLRGHEVTQLQLDAIDWRGGTLMIVETKGRRVHQMPLPAETGEAIASYLRFGRPGTNNRAVFVRHVAPVDKPLTVAGIRNIMNRAFVRCGLADRFCNTHALRHTAAVRLQRAGASLKEIADLLGHRSVDTTAGYARVDLERLRAVTLPWPGRSI